MTDRRTLPEDVGVVALTMGGPACTDEVEAFLVDPPYDQDRLVYRVGRNTPEVGFYDYHRWAAPLSRMLPKVVADSFGTVRGVASIEPTVTPSPTVAIPLATTLTGRLFMNGRSWLFVSLRTCR